MYNRNLPDRSGNMPHKNREKRAWKSTIAEAGLFSMVSIAGAYGPYHTPASVFISDGDQVVVNQNVSVPSGSKVYFQNGETMRRAGVKQSKPYCYFHLYRAQALLDSPATVSADTFDIDSAYNRLEYVQLDSAPLQVAERLVTAGFITQDASEQTMVTRIKLRSATQPEVMHLNCAVWAVPNERNHPSLEEVRLALGNLVTLQLSGD